MIQYEGIIFTMTELLSDMKLINKFIKKVINDVSLCDKILIKHKNINIIRDNITKYLFEEKHAICQINKTNLFGSEEMELIGLYNFVKYVEYIIKNLLKENNIPLKCDLEFKDIYVYENEVFNIEMIIYVNSRMKIIDIFQSIELYDMDNFILNINFHEILEEIFSL